MSAAGITFAKWRRTSLLIFHASIGLSGKSTGLELVEQRPLRIFENASANLLIAPLPVVSIVSASIGPASEPQ